MPKGQGPGPGAWGPRPGARARDLGLVIKGKHTTPYPENLNFHILVFGPFTLQIEEWRARE